MSSIKFLFHLCLCETELLLLLSYRFIVTGHIVPMTIYTPLIYGILCY